MKLYGLDHSPPTHAVAMTLSVLDIENYHLEIIKEDKIDDILREFTGTKLNRHKHVPLLIDGHTRLNDSASIMVHLVEKYGGKSHFLYPADRPDVRARIDERLRFYTGSFWQAAYKTFVRSFLTI